MQLPSAGVKGDSQPLLNLSRVLMRNFKKLSLWAMSEGTSDADYDIIKRWKATAVGAHQSHVLKAILHSPRAGGYLAGFWAAQASSYCFSTRKAAGVIWIAARLSQYSDLSQHLSTNLLLWTFYSVHSIPSYCNINFYSTRFFPFLIKIKNKLERKLLVLLKKKNANEIAPVL